MHLLIPPLRFWFLWVFASAGGLIIGGMSSFFVYAQTAQWFLTGAVLGLCTGLGQAATFYFSTGVRGWAGFWAALTSLGFAIGLLISMTPGGDNPMLGAILGLSVGIAQWLVLGKIVSPIWISLLWIPTNSVAATAAMAMIYYGPRLSVDFPLVLGLAGAIAILIPATLMVYLLTPRH